PAGDVEDAAAVADRALREERGGASQCGQEGESQRRPEAGGLPPGSGLPVRCPPGPDQADGRHVRSVLTPTVCGEFASWRSETLLAEGQGEAPARGRQRRQGL